jgi:hypothetical protein
MPCTARACIPRHFAPHGSHELEPSGVQRRRDTEQQCRSDRAAYQEHADAPISASRREPDQLRQYRLHGDDGHAGRCFEHQSYDREAADRGR